MAGRKYPKADEVQIDGNRIFSPVRKKWLPLTPEEQVRQQYLTVLIDEYGYSLDQIDEEVNVTGRGAAQARADFLIWRTAQDKTDSKAPFIVVECKSDNVSIKPADYTQGENYARIADAPFFVTHNSRETRFWRVKKDRMPGYIEEIENIPHANASDKEIKELLEKLRINAEVLHGERAEYGKQIVVSLADELVVLYGKSFEAKNLRRMMQFAECFPDIEIVVPLARQLSWSHFLALIPLKSSEARLFYARTASESHWNKRELRRQIERKAFERSEIADTKLAVTAVNHLSGNFKDPYFLYFLGLKDGYLENELESALLKELELFILELGKGFAFVERQKRMIIDGEDFYLDLLFFHRKLKQLVAVDLKIDRFKAAFKGQMELYLNWLNKYERQEGEEAPIGLILCAEAGTEQVELLNMQKDNIMVAEYWTDLPPKKLLEKKLHNTLIEVRERLAEQKRLGGGRMSDEKQA